ncbi:MAG: 1-acyl-sn-glycerol-3-phosphate acyltransferase [Armatimonadetes bacterium]|nr:1-acyl-sn-glycerol-3-phosphate acyltransferase [Armatimonadota bacterium]
MFLRSLTASLRGVYLEGELPEGPAVLAMNHHSYFDGHLAGLLARLAGQRVSVLVSAENLRAFPVLAAVGAVDARRVREALRRLRRGEWIAVFVEGELRYPGTLGPVRRGARYLADRAGVPLVPVAVRVVLRGFELPEAFVWVGPPVPPGQDLAEVLGGGLRRVDETLAATHPRTVPPQFRLVLRGRSSLDERVARWIRWFRWVGGEI